jgi:hypothetical protein
MAIGFVMLPDVFDVNAAIPVTNGVENAILAHVQAVLLVSLHPFMAHLFSMGSQPTNLVGNASSHSLRQFAQPTSGPLSEGEAIAHSSNSLKTSSPSTTSPAVICRRASSSYRAFSGVGTQSE